MAALPSDETPELHPARLVPRPHTPAPVRTATPRRRRGVVHVALVLGLVAALAYGIWQEGAAGEARSRLATLSVRFDDLRAEVTALQAEKDELHAEIDRIREENERLAGENAALRASADGAVDDQAVVALILPYVRDRLGDSLGSLAEGLSLEQLGDLLARHWEQLTP